MSGRAFVELFLAVLDKEAFLRFRAKGFSMSPCIKDGDILTVAPWSGRRPRIGDVVAYIHPASEKLVVHRIVGKRGNYYLIKGDNVLETDGFLPAESILAHVKKVERDGKEVHFGFGPERFLIAFTSRRQIFLPLFVIVWKLVRPIFRRFAA